MYFALSLAFLNVDFQQCLKTLNNEYRHSPTTFVVDQKNEN